MNNDDLANITRRFLLPSDTATEALNGGVIVIDGLLEAGEHEDNGFLTKVNYLSRHKLRIAGKQSLRWERGESRCSRWTPKPYDRREASCCMRSKAM